MLAGGEWVLSITGFSTMRWVFSGAHEFHRFPNVPLGPKRLEMTPGVTCSSSLNEATKSFHPCDISAATLSVAWENSQILAYQANNAHHVVSS